MFDLSQYSPAIRALLAGTRLAPLGPGHPNEPARTLLSVGVEKLFAPTPVRDANFTQACLAGLWLHHDFLDESHKISQDLSTAEGSYWHGLMHRREPDFGNSKYWFRQVGKHPVFVPLCTSAASLIRVETASHGLPPPDLAKEYWDSFAFIDLCEESYHGRAPFEGLCREIQAAEWQLLFDYCYEHSV